MEDKLQVYRTIAQIEAETKTPQFCRPVDFARAMALTKFLRELEAELGEQFRLMCASPRLFVNRNAEEKTGVFGIGLWATWLVGETEYYTEMNENPFFDAYLQRTWRLDRVKSKREYCTRMNNILYENVTYDADASNIEQIVKNFQKAFKIVNERNIATYVKEIPPYARNDQQKFYM